MSWTVSFSEGTALDEPAIRELYAFRLSIMRLKPHVSPEKDFAKFSAWVRQGRRVVRMRDSRGRLGGLLVPLVYDGSWQSQRARVVVPEYAYLVPELRGRAWCTLVWARSLFPLLYARGVRVFLGGLAYPTGTLALDRFMGPVWLHGEPQAPAESAQVLEWIVSHVAGDSWEPASRTVDMNTLPSQPTERWLARSQGRELYRRYIARCPRWQEGYTLPCVCEFSSAKALRTGLWTLRRWWNHATD